MKIEWILCPFCGSKTRLKIRDDTILDNLEDYINGHIDKTRFLEMMKLKWSNKQISFHTVKALKRLKFIECEKIKK